MGTNCAPLLVDLFLYSYEAAFIQTLVKEKNLHKIKPLIGLSGILMMFFSINKPNFANWIELINLQRS
jgi:hypothetical protein